jgi:molybdopterin molybdotransferase
MTVQRNDSDNHLMNIEQIASCISGYDPKALPVAKAQEFIARFVEPFKLQATERVAIRAALGRTLAQDIISPINVPAHDNSAMDGYALRGADLSASQETRLSILGTGYAGVAYTGAVAQGQCVKVMTGAVMPQGTDTVVPQEFCKTEADAVLIPAGVVRLGDNTRNRGEDLAIGSIALKAGKCLRPADLGLLASLGQAEVSVYRKLRVAFFSTGDELRSIGEELDEGCVYDSNRYTIYGMLSRLGVDIMDMGVVRDEPAALEAAFRSAAANADAIITSGGVSVGEADYTKRMMRELGEVAFWTIAMRPGRPMAFGSIAHEGKRAALFGLPGNPVAVMVTFYHFVREGLLRMQGQALEPLPLMRAISKTALRKKPGRTEYQRGIVTPRADGRYEVSITGSQGSGILRSMSEANCFVMLHHEQGNVDVGGEVDVLLFDGLI